jgi:hypothetical protein
LGFEPKITTRRRRLPKYALEGGVRTIDDAEAEVDAKKVKKVKKLDAPITRAGR